MRPLLLLHGALGAADQFASLALRLADRFEVLTLDFEGHGHSPPRGRPFRIEHFAMNVVELLEERRLSDVGIFGYSMGGYVALHLALTRPELVRSVVTLATKFDWTPESAAREGRMLEPATIEAKVPHFARALATRHPGGWQEVVLSTREMLASLGAAPLLDAERLATLDRPVRITVGDRDATVGVEESARIARALPKGELEVHPATPHPFEKAPVERLVRSITDVRAA